MPLVCAGRYGAAVSVIYLRRVLPHVSIVLPSNAPCGLGRDHPLSALVYANFQPPGCTARCVTARLVGSYPTFSPLPLHHGESGGCFLLHRPTLASPFPLGSGVPYAARTFLLRRYEEDASDRPPRLISYKIVKELEAYFFFPNSGSTLIKAVTTKVTSVSAIARMKKLR